MSSSTTLRRSSRRSAASEAVKKMAKKEAEEERSGDEEAEAEETLAELESSGSDFEEEMMKTSRGSRKKVKRKIDQNGHREESTSEEEDEDEDALEEEVADLKGKGRGKKSNPSAVPSKLSRTASMERRRKKLLNGAASQFKNGNDSGAVKTLNNLGSPAPVSSSLSLSESSSDEEGEGAVAVPVGTGKHSLVPTPQQKVVVTPASPEKMSKDSEAECPNVASQLAALASQASMEEEAGGGKSNVPMSPDFRQPEQPWIRISPHASEEAKAEEEQESQDEAAVKTEEFDKEVAEALAMGEDKKQPSLSDEDSEEEKEEETQEEQAKKEDSSGIKGVEVTVSLPGGKGGKKKRDHSTAFADYIRREVNRNIRENQLMMHQAHIVCLVAHVRYLSATCATPLLKAVALSVTPAAHLATADKVTPVRLTQLLSWFRSAVGVWDSGAAAAERFPRPLMGHLTKAFQRHEAQSGEDLVLMFLLVTRAIGWRARLVHNFVCVPQKPDAKSLLTAKKPKTPEPKEEEVVEEDDPKPSTSKDAVSKAKSSKKEGKSSSSGKEIKKSKEYMSSDDDDSDDDDLISPPPKAVEKGKSAKKDSSSKGRSKPDSKSENKTSKASKRKPESGSSRDSSPEKKRKEEEGPKTRKGSKRKSDSQRKRDDSPEVKAKRRSTRSRSQEKDDTNQEAKVTGSKSKGRSKSSTSAKATVKKDDSRGSSSRKKGKSKQEVRLSAKAVKEAENRRSSRSRRSVAPPPKAKRRGRSTSEEEDYEEEEEDSEEEFVPEDKAKKKAAARRRESTATSSLAKGKTLQSDKAKAGSSKQQQQSKKSTKKVVDYWVEVLVKGEWTCVDVVRGKAGSSSVAEMEAGASQPMLYVVACDETGSVKDVTRRYVASKFMTDTRKKRVAELWIEETLGPFRTRDRAGDEKEDRQLQKALEALPMPTSISGFKDHPMYALERHLLKYQAIYPPDAPTVGFIRGEAVYPRECVHTLQGRVNWTKEGRMVKIGEEAYRTTKPNPKWDRVLKTIVKGEQPLELFGFWQTEIYVPPPAENGKVPRNEYGNVELFKPWMLPKGAVHLPVQGKRIQAFFVFG